MTEKKALKPLKVFALGGLNEVGKNCYCIEYANQIFIIDCGLLFPDEQLLGVDVVIPDFTYLLENQSKIVGLFITHGHEDHIGGIPYLLKQVKIPAVYASGIAIDLIKGKCQESKIDVNIIPFEADTIFKFKHSIEVSFIRMTHSIPDAYAICFKTPYGYVVDSGDFKMDLTPIGPSIEFDKLAKIGKEGVAVLLADSTNSEKEGYTVSEQKVTATIKDLFGLIDGRVIIATFASNVHRIEQIVEASIENNRKIAVFGRSMTKNLEVGQNLGYITNKKGIFIDPLEINRYPAKKLTLICTGSQGEEMAALSRIANGSHRFIKIQPNDTIIYSSSPIPGNATSVNKTINQLYKRGAKVIVNNSLNDTHTSGHASQNDQLLLLSLLKPKYFIPAHGEYRMLKAHADTAISSGVLKENTFLLSNGDVFTLTEKGVDTNSHVPTDNIYVDGNDLDGLEGAIIRERKILSTDGIFAICFSLDLDKKALDADPQIVSRGFMYMKDNEELTRNLQSCARSFIEKELVKYKAVNLMLLKNNLNEYISKIIYEKTQRKPMVTSLLTTHTNKKENK